MNVLVCSDLHFIEVDGRVFSGIAMPTFFQRYREVWDEVVVLGRLAHASRPPSDAPPLDFQGIRIVGLPDYTGPMQYLRNRRSIRRIVRRTLPHAQSIMLRGAHTISKSVYSMIRGLRRPYGIELLGDPQDAMAPGAMRHPFRPFFRWQFKRDAVRICRDAYASTYVTAQALQRRYPPSPGRFTTHFTDAVITRLDRPRESFPAGGPYCLIAIGTFATMYKAHDVLLQAVAMAVNAGMDLNLVIVGDGMHLSEMQQLARDLGIADRVKFCGLLPPGARIFAELDRAHLFVMPSRQEGLPRAMVEAMARALPCIGSTVGGIPELLGPAELVPPNDAAALAAKIREIVSDPTRMISLSKRNWEMSAEYSEDVLHAKRVDFFQHVRAGTEIWLRGRGAGSALRLENVTDGKPALHCSAQQQGRS